MVAESRTPNPDTGAPPLPALGLIHHSSKTVEYYTPHAIVDPIRSALGGFDLDPASCLAANQFIQAANYYTRQKNGLILPWWGKIWMNSPYGIQTTKPTWSTCPYCFGGYSNKWIWLERLVSQYRTGLVTEAAALVTASTGDVWFRRFIWNAADAILFPPRINFVDGHGRAIRGQPGASAIAYYGRRRRRFAKYTRHLGPCMTCWNKPENRHEK